MQRFLVLLMLFILPIRGLVGDAMAYSMLPLAPGKTQNQVSNPPQNTPELIANYLISTSEKIEKNGVNTSVKPPCHTDTASAESTSPDAQQCTTCQVCHLSVAVPILHVQPVVHTLALPAVQSATAWHSAEPRLIAKTPIV
jgi:hypothetical protein